MNISRLEEQIEALEKEMEEATKHIDEQIEHLQEYIEQWERVSEEYEEAQNEMLAAQILGAEWEADILATRQDVLENFKNEYIRIQQEMADAAVKAAEAALKAEKMLAGKGSGNGSGNGSGIDSESGSGGGNPDDTTKKYKEVIRYTVGNEVFDSESEAIEYAEDNGYHKEDIKVTTIKIPINAKGGVVGKKEDSLLSSLAEAVGEDQLVAVQNGERILTPYQNKNFEKLIAFSDKLIPTLTNNKFFDNLFKIPVTGTTNTNNITLSIGDIHLHEVNDVDTFSKAIINQFPGKIIQAINKR